MHDAEERGEHEDVVDDNGKMEPQRAPIPFLEFGVELLYGRGP